MMSAALHRWPLLACALACALATACDGGARTPDAQAQQNAYASELSVRFETGADKTTTVSVLGFRAIASGTDESSVLGLVDPLAADAPDQGCVLRDADVATNTLGMRGGSVDLQELAGVGVALPGPETLLRPFPRVYPDVAGVVSGVVAEAGQAMAAVPDRVSLYAPDTELPVAELPVPALPALLAVNGAAPVAGARVDASAGLALTLSNPAGALVELRPFGATVAISCAVPSNASTEATLAIPHALLVHLSPVQAAPALPVSIEVARRARTRAPLAGAATRVSLEVRSTLAVELRP
jgi:hypothetical protein